MTPNTPDSFVWNEKTKIAFVDFLRLQHMDLPIFDAIEQFKASTHTPREEKGRDWEVETLADTLDGRYIVYPFAKGIPDDRFKIHSVRRISDGEVFAIGDGILFHIKDDRFEVVQIKEFDIDKGGKIWAIDKRGYGIGFSAWQKPKEDSPKDPKREVLFVTKKNEPVYMGDEGWVVDNDTWELMSDTARNTPIPSWFEAYEYFKDKEDAILYVQENKPVLSYNDVVAVLDKLPMGQYDFSFLNIDKLKQLIKERVKC